MEEKTKVRRIYNPDILSLLKERYGFSLDYLRKSLRNERKGLMPTKIIEEYESLEFESRKAINEAIKMM